MLQFYHALRRCRWLALLLPLMLLLACERETADNLATSPMVIAAPCDIHDGCVAEGDGISVTLSMGPELRALTPFPVRVEIQRGPSIESMTVAFGMKGMDMGLNRYGFIKDKAGQWRANVTLPVCISGRSDWIADLELLTEGRRYQLQVPFVLEK